MPPPAAAILPPLGYDDMLARHEQNRDGVPFLFVPRPDNAARRLIVTFATYNNGDRYAAAETVHRRLSADFLGLRDPTNSYYLEADGGARFQGVLAHVLARYDPARVLMFGSSMAGYAALRWALHFDANALVSNPQVNLDATLPLAWDQLRASIAAIPRRVNLDELALADRHCALTCLHSRHPMDLENMRRLFAAWLRLPGMSLALHQTDEDKHRYLFRDFGHFQAMVEQTFQSRAIGANLPPLA